jgi:Cu2+-exporting ATPase
MTSNSYPSTNRKVLLACAHCGLPTPACSDEERVFCCNGCMGAYALIHEMGCEDYYKLRTDSGASLYVRESEQKIAALEDLESAGVPVRHLPGGLDCVRLSVDGMHCAACSWLIERIQPSIRGLHSARVRLSDHSVELVYDPHQTNIPRVASRLSKIGYQLAPWQEDLDRATDIIDKQRDHWFGIATAAFLAANAMWIGIALYAGEASGISPDHEYFLRWIGAILGLLSALGPGKLFFQTAWQAIRVRTPHVDIPVALSLAIGTIGSLYAAWMGSGHMYFDSLTSLVLLLRIGRYLQFRAQSRAKSSIHQLLRWNTQIAQRIDGNGEFHSVPASRLAEGDLIYVEPGAIIPADGTVESGESSVDTSLLTGETQPVIVRSRSCVVGGTTNLSSPLQVRVDAAGDASRMGKLMAMVREATTYHTPWIQAADRVGKWFVVVVLFLGCATWVGWALYTNVTVATQHTMALLTIACPCALALAAPLVITIALGRAAKRQIWIREGDCLEKLANPGMLWLDKTGTITLGRIHVHQWTGEDRWLPYAFALEQTVVHPVASAIVRFSEAYDDLSCQLSVTDIIQERGFGVTGIVGNRRVTIGNEPWMRKRGVQIQEQDIVQARSIASKGQTAIWFSVDHSVVGMFTVGDALRPDAVETLMQLQKMGWKLGVLSGDHPEVVLSIAQSLRDQGIVFEQVLGEQSPEDKLHRIQESRRTTKQLIAMVGDGINDAAALAAADVGIAVRGNTEQSLNVAPIYIANPRLSSLLELFHASKQVVVGIKRCFQASLIYNSITISLAVFGWIHPLIAALFMPLSGLTVLAMAMHSRTFLNQKLFESERLRPL